MFRVMITASGSGIGHNIVKAVMDSDLDCEIVTTDAGVNAAGLYRGKAGYIVPRACSPEFIDEIIRIARQEDISAILVGTDYELLPFAENRERILAETGATVLVSSPEVIRTCTDKWLTHCFLTENGFPSIPSALPVGVEQLMDEEGFPLIIKPRIGDSSKNMFVVHGIAELKEKLAYLDGGGENNQYLQGKPSPMIQKYMGTERTEFTSSTLTLDGKVLGAISMRREMRYPGHTTKATINGYSRLNHWIAAVAMRLQPFGPCNFQSRMVDGVPYVFEINCRFSGTTGICAEAGFNHVDACLRRVVLNQEVQPLKYQMGVAIRYFDEVFVPQEDLDQMARSGVVRNPAARVHRSESNQPT